MHVNYHCSLLSTFLLVCSLVTAPCAQAVVIKAADYAIGTNLTDAFPGMILKSAAYNGSGPGFTTSPLVIGADADFVEDGDGQFNTLGGSTDASGFPPFQIPSNDGPWDAIYIAFTVPVYSVTAAGLNEDDDPAAMVAYGASGQQLDVEIDNGGFLPSLCVRSHNAACLEWHEETVNSTVPISYVLVGGESEETLYMELGISGISSVPEPSPLALFGCGLVVIGATISGRRRSGGRRNYHS